MYTQQLANDFWLEFDNLFQFEPTPEVITAYSQLGSIDRPQLRWRARRADGTYPAGFKTDMLPVATPLKTLGLRQLEIIDKHFQGDAAAEQHAFEDFGRGILWDDRRPPGMRLHMMDTSSPINPPIGYHRWHTCIRGLVAVGGDAARWLTINRYVGLAWHIQSIVKPVQDTRSNPTIDPATLAKLRTTWLSATTDQIDAAFDSRPYPAGVA